MFPFIAALSAASALLCLYGMLFSTATMLGKVLLGLVFCAAVGGLIASVERIISQRRDEKEEPELPASFEKPVTIPQAPFAGNAFSNDYKANTPAAPVTQENPWKFVPPYRPIPADAPPFPAPIQHPAPHSTPPVYVPQQQPIQTVTPTGNNGVGAALGGLALGTLLGAHLGSGAVTAQAAAADEERRRRNNQTTTAPGHTQDSTFDPPAALPAITADEAEAQATRGIEDFEVVADEPAAGVALAPITADEAEAKAQATETAPFDAFDRVQDHLDGINTLAPITAEEAEAAQTVEQEPETYQSPVTEPYRYEPEPAQSGVALEPITADEAERSTPSYSAPEPYRAPEPEPTRYEPEPYRAPDRDPDPVPDTSWSDTASTTWDSGSSWSD